MLSWLLSFHVVFRNALQERKSSLNIKLLGGIFLRHQGPRRRDILGKNFMQVACCCCSGQGVAGISRDLGGTSRIWKNFMQDIFGLIFRFLSDGSIRLIRRTVLGSSRGPCYQRDLPVLGISPLCELVVC